MNVVYLSNISKQAIQEQEFASLAAQVESHNQFNAMKQLIAAAFAPSPPNSKTAL